MGQRAVWLADWTDEEHAALMRAWGPDAPMVLRSTPLGTSVGSPLHRLRSYPAYVALALRGSRRCPKDGVLVAWQPLAGAVAGLLPRRRRPGLVVLNPLLTVGDGSLRARVVRAGVRRADLVVLYSRAAVAEAVRQGLDPARIEVVRLGVESHPDAAPPLSEAPLLAAGRDHRDWPLLAAAAAAAGVRVLVAGPTNVPAPLEVVRPASKLEFQELVRRSRAVVVPLLDDRRQAGTLAVLDGLAAGRPVLATRGPGTEDYVPASAGQLVPPGDVGAMATALAATSDPAQLAAWAAGARAAAEELSLVRFLEQVGAAVQEVADRRHAG